MDDTRLLELAGKAAGEQYDAQNNPLERDDLALRLAVKLCIGLDHNRAGDQQRYVAASRPGCEGCFSPVCAVEDEFDESQRAAATRRAIVRAAAEIGRQHD